MATRDLHNNMRTVTSLVPATRTADANGTGVDTTGYESVELVVPLGLSGDTLSGSVKLDLEVEESDDDSTYTDVAEADLIGATSGTTTGNFGTIDAAAEDEKIYRVGYRGRKKYVRPVLNFTGTHTNGIPCAAMVVLGNPRHAPASGE